MIEQCFNFLNTLNMAYESVSNIYAYIENGCLRSFGDLSLPYHGNG